MSEAQCQDAFVSAVVTTYNRREEVVRAVRSALAQTWRNLEVIVVDDGSTDGTEEALAPLAGQIRYCRQSNSGVVTARNRGISMARGEFIALLDSDDLWLPKKIESQVRALQRFRGQIGVCFTNCGFFGSAELRRTSFQMAGLEEGGGTWLLEDPVAKVLARVTPFYPSAFLAERRRLKEIGCFDSRLRVNEDIDVFFRLGLNWPFAMVEAPLTQIDRSPLSGERMSEWIDGRSEWSLASEIYLWKKFLQINCLAPPIRGLIEDFLKESYYNRAVSRLYRGRLISFFRGLSDLKEVGHSYPRVFSTLAFRLRRRLTGLARKSAAS